MTPHQEVSAAPVSDPALPTVPAIVDSATLVARISDAIAALGGGADLSEKRGVVVKVLKQALKSGYAQIEAEFDGLPGTAGRRCAAMPS